ncbi:MAG: leucine-rich repeat protein [Prevotella sp.]|nr:leucine-rich repeat protein [Prevotella sp.]
MKRKIIKLLLAVVCLLCSTSVSAYDFEVDGIYYNYINNRTELQVTYRDNSASYSNAYLGNVVIPESVTYVGKTYSVTSIGDRAFYGCSGLTSVTIPSSITTSGAYAFSYCI